MTLSEALRSYRIKHHLLQKQVAAALQISLKHYTEIENGHSYASSTVMKRLCELTGIEISYSFSAREMSARYRSRRHRRKRSLRKRHAPGHHHSW
ncbi:MAG TPA: helix-turn-helix transcriptional regulator [Bacteroidota bacterium]|nr:helix-turn-helix transcriptional regulator [Bacteroidota bacterium]